MTAAPTFSPGELASPMLPLRCDRLLAAIWRLAWFRPEGQPLTRVNWRDMETEELGSVYRGLLELTPRASADRRSFTFPQGAETRGNERKRTGSYYTPDAPVKLLLDATLDPVLDAAEARNPADPAAEILKLRIIDPACGSGHFLLGASRRAATRIARARSPGAPSRIEFQRRCARSSPTASMASTRTRSRSSCARWRSGSRRWNRASRSPSSTPASAPATA